MTNREYVMQFAAEYAGSQVCKPDEVIDGIELFIVGHNASHQFYLGVDDKDNAWRMSAGESGWDDEENMPIYSQHMMCIGSDIMNVGYIGHY